MNYIIYSCENPGEVKKLSPDEYQGVFVSSQFCIVKKYERLYKEVLSQLENCENTPYALPAKKKITCL